MVNVNKNIVPGKKAESLVKTEPQAPARRPRNQALNSSKTSIDVKRASKGRHPFSINLNSSKKLNCSLADSPLSLEVMTEMLQNLFPGYSNEEIKQIMRESYDTAIQNYPEYDEPTLLKQMLWDDFGITDDMLEEISDVTDVEAMKRLSEDANLWSDNPNFVDNYGEGVNSSVCSDNTTDESLNSAEDGSSSADVNVEGCLETLVNHLLDYAPKEIHSKAYLGEIDTPLEDATFYVEADGKYVEPITAAYTSIKGDDYDAFIAQPGIADIPIHYLCTETMDYSGWKDTTMGNLRQVLQEEVAKINTSDVNSSKNQSMNCSSDITEDDFEYDEYGSGMSTKDYMGYTIYKSVPDEASGSAGYMVYDGDYPQSFDTLEECKEFIRDTLNSSKKLNSSAAEETNLDDIKITTESGNEVSMQDIKIVQNPDTNELAIFIPEDEEETIPEGFSVIGMVVPDTLDSAPAIEGGDVCPECGQEPCVCEGANDDEALDSSKKKTELNCDSSEGDCFAALWTAYIDDEYKCACCGKPFPAGHGTVYLGGHKPDGMHFIYEYTKDNRVGNSVNYDPYNLPPEDSEGGIFKVIVGEEADDEGYHWLNFCRNCWPKLTSKSPEEIYKEYSVPESENKLTQESVNSSLGGGDDRQDATSQVTVPKSFPDDKVHDLYRWVESELQHEGIDVDVYGVGRPSAGTISFEFEVTGSDPVDVDAIIEDRVKAFIANGNTAAQYSEGDFPSELNSEKHEKSLNCKVENARVEQTEQGTWVVRADTDRFGKDAILYEHYSEEGANKYLDRLKAGGDAVANGYGGHIDPKKVDLDSGDGTAEAKLDKTSISKAMSKVILEDKDTPLVTVKMKDGAQAYIQPAGYEDNQLVADGNFEEAKVYVAMYDKDFKPIMVNGKMDNKMSGSEVVDYIKRNLGM